jgi:hypothetical protein
MASPILPDSFESWKHCITITCGITLTTAYVETRISILKDTHEKSTKRFIALYGADHYHNVLNWFEQSRMALIS